MKPANSVLALCGTTVFEVMETSGATPDVDHLVRFCFCKKDEVFVAVVSRL